MHERRDVPGVEEVVESSRPTVFVRQQRPRVPDDHQDDQGHLGVVEPRVALLRRGSVRRSLVGTAAWTTATKYRPAQRTRRPSLDSAPCVRIRRPAPPPAGGGVRRDRARWARCCSPGRALDLGRPSSGRCPAAGSTSASIPATPWCARCTRRPGCDCTLGDPLWIGSAHRVVDRETRSRRSCTPCGSCTTPGWPPTPRSPGSSRSTARRSTRAGPRSRTSSRGRSRPCRWCCEALARHRTARRQRLAAYALVLRDDEVLLTRNSPRGPRPGTWTLPGGGVDHGEPPADAVVREVREETGLVATVGDAARRARRALHRHRPERARGGLPRRRPRLRGRRSGRATRWSTSRDGTTDAAAWVPLAEVASGAVAVSTVVTAALAMGRGR